MEIDGKEIKFFRSDGTPAQGAVGEGGITEDGEIMFFEILDMVRPLLNKEHKYARVMIRRVFPLILDLTRSRRFRNGTKESY